MATKESQAVKIEGMRKDVGFIKEQFQEVKEMVSGMNTKLDSHYVTKEEFEPIKKIVYGVVAIVLIAFMGAVVSLVIINNGGR